MKKRLISLVATVVAASMMMVGCGSSASSGTSSEPVADTTATTAGTETTAETASAAAETTSGAKDTLVVALQGEPSSLDAQYADDTNMFWVTWNINEGLVVFNGETLEVEPLLATAWENVDDTTWKFTIREGVKFHDGTDMTAEDVAYSINRMIDPDFGSQFASDFSTITGAEVTGDYEVTVTTDGPDPILLKRMTKMYVVSKATTEGKSTEELTTISNGTGPYKLVSWKQGSQIDLTANTDYWGDAPSIPNVTFRFIEEASTRVSAIQTGEVDIAVNMLPEYIDQLPQVVSGPGMENYFMRLNATSGIMSSPELRMAVNYAVDKEAIADALFLGYATPEPGQIAQEGTTGYSSAVEAYPFDQEKAKELIAASGYNGEEIQLISEKTRWTKDGEVTEAVASMLQEVGLNVTVKFLSWSEWLDMLFDKTQTPDMMFSSTSNEFQDVDRIFSSSVHSAGTQSAMADADVDALIEAGQKEMDEAKRQEIYDELNTMLYNNPPKLYLVTVDELHGAAANVDWVLRKDCRVYLKTVSFK